MCFRGLGKFCLSPQLFLLGHPHGRTPILQTRLWRHSLTSHSRGVRWRVGEGIAGALEPRCLASESSLLSARLPSPSADRARDSCH